MHRAWIRNSPALAILLLACSIGFVRADVPELKPIRIGDDHKSFVIESTRHHFVPRGFNYDHDESGRLLEDYWAKEWPKIEKDFAAMRQLGGNVVRIHLQTGKFLDGPVKINTSAIGRLAKLVKLAERERIYLDVTGLGCYHKKDVPDWFDALTESERWRAQAFFWQEVAACCANSPAIFCYDLMNEPVVPGGKRAGRDWLGGAFAGKHFVQFITLDQAGRDRPQIACDWIRTLRQGIRRADNHHLVTAGLVDWSLDRKGLTSGFVPEKVATELDFSCVHLYPSAGKVDEAITTLSGFAVGKPVVIEETFPLKCSIQEFEEFLDKSNKFAAGWIGFYWGKSPDELRKSRTIADAMTLGWLDLFERKTKAHADKKDP